MNGKRDMARSNERRGDHLVLVGSLLLMAGLAEIVMMIGIMKSAVIVDGRNTRVGVG